MAVPWQKCIEEDLEALEELIATSLSTKSQELTEMCCYVVGSGGKRLRPSLCLLSYYICGGVSSEEPLKIGSALEIVHSATLIHDDINDQGELRRGRKVLHKEYTVNKAIIAGDFMLSTGFQLLAMSAPKIVGHLADVPAYMGAGEFIQKDFEHSPDVSEDDYMDIILGKTAKLFEASAKCGAEVAGASAEMIDALGTYAVNLGIAFQITDDTLDVRKDLHNTGKSVGTDWLEGKPTLPVIYAMEDPTHGPRIKELFMKTEVIDEDVAEALSLILETDSVPRCLAKATEYAEEAKKAIASLPESEYKDSMMSLADFVVGRDR